ncbi:protein DWD HYPERSENSITIVE TO UV-B 1-like [Malania oleifera]|uniref:protein DWD HYPERSENSITIVE TO UV-B 1-like n=1 Tax=Malania oleifera TaxID=397392 RepID=UPI0025ADF972|nr:protein DWD HYPERSENSITIVE TO UV-B 1-like [Malania oleifera]
MSLDISTLEARYLESCERNEVAPNVAVLSWFNKAKIQKSHHKKCCIVVLLDHLKDADFSPLIDVFTAIDSSNTDAVDILNESPCILNEEYVMSLMRTINLKLRVVDLQDMSFGKDFFQDLSWGGLACRVLNLTSSHIQKLNMVGRFMQLHTLNLDFCTSLTSLQKDCFACMPNLMCLSMCETRVANLWTTSAALSKLPSLVELRFQNCLCCSDTGPCPKLSSEKTDILLHERTGLGQLKKKFYSDTPPVDSRKVRVQDFGTDEAVRSFVSNDDSLMVHDVQTAACNISENCEARLSSHLQRISLLELSSGALSAFDGHSPLQNEVSFDKLHVRDEDESIVSALNLGTENTPTALKKYISHHPSPICFEKHYREYMVASLPRLEVLDNLPIRKTDREMAKVIFSKYFEYLPYKHQHKESVVSALLKREMGTASIHWKKSSTEKCPSFHRKGQHYFSRSLCAAKVGSSAWPLMCPVSNICQFSKEESKIIRPRQFEYHPSNSSLMAFGTLDGEVVVLNHENGNLVGYVPSTGVTNSVLGLCWLRKYPSKLLAGSDNGSLKLYDINGMLRKVADVYCSSSTATFDDFEQLTSVHVNSMDDQFLASGYSKHVALYDIGTGRRLQLFTDLHREPINVAKFAHHSPSIFATSSFDHDVKMWDLRQKPVRPCYTASSSRGNVMVCFSPDDLYLLVSAVDNEVKQLLAVDGRLHMNFEITSTGSAHNYTRSYYINGRDYVISGSSEEHVVHICCAQTGRRLRDVDLEDRGSGSSMFVQSLRGDPFRDFHMSVLAAYRRPGSKWEIIKVNLLESNHNAKENFCSNQFCPSYGLGG